MIELRFGDTASQHVVSIFLAKTVRECDFGQLSPRVPLELASFVGEQVALIVIPIVVLLITDQVFPVDELIARIIRIFRADDGISYSDFADTFEQFVMAARFTSPLTMLSIVAKICSICPDSNKKSTSPLDPSWPNFAPSFVQNHLFLFPYMCRNKAYEKQPLKRPAVVLSFKLIGSTLRSHCS
jgi:hypothetical protein